MASFAVALLLVGCSGDPGSPPDSSEDDIKSAATEGQSCGGFVAHPKHCASGLSCIVPSGSHPDAPGICQKDDAAEEGESCGGTVAKPKQCAIGLKCVMPTPHAIGGTGTCKR
jgi:hypothetical protein